MTIEIRSNVGEVRRTMADLIQQQLPFATAKAVNDVALEARTFLQLTVRQAFTIRRPWVIAKGAFPVTLAKKAQDPKRAIIRVDASRDFFTKFEDGGTKTSRTGKALTVPIEARPTKASLVPKRLSVRALNLTATRTKAGKVQLKGNDGTFVVKTGTQALILQRRKRAGVRVLYAFKRSVPIRPMLHFYDTLNTYVQNHWSEVAGTAMRKALQSAR